MNTRIKFTKSGPSKFIGHLDIMRYFQKAFRRSEIDVEYSKGFSPHQITSFASPLGVGLTSDGEYMDAQLQTCDKPEIMIQRINEVMNEDIQAISFQILPDNSKNCMSSVMAADYLISVKDGYEYMNKEIFEQKFKDFYNRETIVITKTSKKSVNDVDIKPLIYKVEFEQDDPNTVAESYLNGIKVYMQLATGSVENLKPELVMQAFCEYIQIEFNKFVYQVHRIEVYTDMGDETGRKLVALDKMYEEADGSIHE